MRAVVTWQKEAPAGEVERLNALLAGLTPPSEHDPYLHAYWEPGDAWHPIERIVIGHVLPRKHLVAQDRFFRSMGYGSDASLFSELEGRNPRDGAHFDRARNLMIYPTWREQPNITQRQWLLWREIGGFVQPRWYVQGPNGGTPRKYTRYEQELRRITQQPKHPPFLGELPYAPADYRVIEALVAHERAQLLSEQVDEEWMGKEEKDMTAAERMLSAALGEWFSTQNEQRAAGKIRDFTYTAGGQVVAHDYSRIERV
jgi:hypothetical protein